MLGWQAFSERYLLLQESPRVRRRQRVGRSARASAQDFAILLQRRECPQVQLLRAGHQRQRPHPRRHPQFAGRKERQVAVQPRASEGGFSSQVWSQVDASGWTGPLSARKVGGFGDQTEGRPGTEP